MLLSEQVIKFPIAEIVQPCLSTFYAQGHWGQALDLLSHLCQYEDKVLLIIGTTGMGKTSLKYALENQGINNLRTIDDAHNLSLDQLGTVMNLRQRVALFALPELLERVKGSELAKEFSQRVRVIELEPLTFAEMKDFLKHYLRTSGHDDSLPFRKSELRKLYSMSAGIPGKLKQLFTDELRGNDVLNPKNDARGLSPFVVGLIVALGIVFCILAFLWPTADDKLSFKKEPLPQPTLVQHIPVRMEPEFDKVYNPKKAENEAKLAKLEEKLVALQQQLHYEKDARKKAEVSVVKVQEPIVPPAVLGTKSEQDILSVRSNHYCLQLIAASNETKVRQFIKDNNLSSKARYYEGTRQGKAWYTVIYGDFSSKTEALQQATNLSEKLRKLGPWARQYVHVQNSIEQHLGND